MFDLINENHKLKINLQLFFLLKGAICSFSNEIAY